MIFLVALIFLIKRRTIMITTRDIKVFIFSILFSTLCYALFNQPLKSAEAQGREAGDGGGEIYAGSTLQ